MILSCLESKPFKATYWGIKSIGTKSLIEFFDGYLSLNLNSNQQQQVATVHNIWPLN